jgi:3-phenylpropionate/cinnamic acid dioxygenase small subunit
MSDDAARLRELEDREAIRNVFVKYAEHLDGGDYQGYASLFARDGVFGEARGREQVAEQMAAYGKRVDQGKAARRFNPAVHLISNVDIDLEGGRARAKAVWSYVTNDPDSMPVTLQFGTYDDDLVREDGEWKIAEHRINRITGRAQLEDTGPTRLDRMERRLQELEDREEIRLLMIKAQDLLDERRVEEYGQLFTEDGVWCGVVGRGVGPKGVAAVLGQFLKPWESEAVRSYHTHNNSEIHVDGDEATSVNRFTHMFPDENGDAWLRHCGRHFDKFRRTPDGWRFTQRSAYSELPYNEPHFQLIGPASEEELEKARTSPDGVWQKIERRPFS